MAHRARLLLLCTLVVCIALNIALAGAQTAQLLEDDIQAAAAAADPQAAAAFAALAAAAANKTLNVGDFLPNITINNASILPCTRPKPWANLRSFATPGQSWKIEQNATSNAGFWTLEHAPIQNVTARMMRWLWGNMNRRARDPRDGRLYPIFLLMHPQDNVRVTYDTARLKVQGPDLNKVDSTAWVWTQLPGSNCLTQFDNAQEPIVCPANRKGFTCRTPLDTLATSRSINITLRCLENSATATTLAFLFNTKEATGLDTTIPFIQARFSYQDDKKLGALRLRTVWTLGYDSVLAKTTGDDINGKSILPLYASQAPATGGDWRKAALFDILNAIQLFGALPQWLPSVYAQATSRTTTKTTATP